jgi:outer membrane lipoprotein-sorting protein
VTLRDFQVGDPPNTRHLYCVPLPGTELADKYSRVDIFFDKRLELPTRIETQRVVDGNRIEVDFRDVDVNEAPAMSRFQIETPPGFTVTEEPLPPMPEGPSAAGDAE